VLPPPPQVDKSRAPYLHFILTEKQEILVLCIGLGELQANLLLVISAEGSPVLLMALFWQVCKRPHPDTPQWCHTCHCHGTHCGQLHIRGATHASTLPNHANLCVPCKLCN
jgi:hypothetical protein